MDIFVHFRTDGKHQFSNVELGRAHHGPQSRAHVGEGNKDPDGSSEELGSPVTRF